MPDQTRILIAEDDREVVELVRVYLEKEGFQVTAAGDGEAALASVETAVPDLLVLDVMLPKLDGWAVCRRIRENEATRLLPVVMLTSRGDEMDRVLGLELGVIGVWLLRALGKTPVVVSWQAVGLSVVFSVAVGILFGVYPARRAAWISPVEALRTE